MSKNESHNIEFLEHIMRDWAENMWKNNNKGKYPDEEASRKAFWDKWYPDNNRGLTKTQSFSEQAFTLFAYGAVYTVGMVSEKALDAATDNTLVNAWRKSVQKNSFQQKYYAFEEILKEQIDKQGRGGAAALFPEFGASGLKPDDLAQALEYINYKSKVVPISEVAGLMRVNSTPPAAAKPAPTAPQAA